MTRTESTLLHRLSRPGEVACRRIGDQPEGVGEAVRSLTWEFLSTEAYWASWRVRQDFENQLASAWRVVGAYEGESGRMVGFARSVSDGVAPGVPG